MEAESPMISRMTLPTRGQWLQAFEVRAMQQRQTRHGGVGVFMIVGDPAWKIQKPANVVCDVGQQMVHIKHVFMNDVIPMYAGRQMAIKTLEDTLKPGFADDGFLRWRVDYRVP